MNSFEFNKIFAAFLCAGIVAMLGGFVSHKLVHPHKLYKNAVEIDGAAIASSGPAKPKMPDPVLHLIATADVAKGQKLSKACAACHSFDKGGPNKVGPNLWKTVGAPKAGHADFAYSNALKESGGAWGYESLNKFLWKPKAYAPGTKMNYIGIKKPEDRAAMIAWLRTLHDAPLPLPTAAEIAAEAAELAPPEPEEAVEVLEDAVEAIAN
jgi:cytochrome c